MISRVARSSGSTFQMPPGSEVPWLKVVPEGTPVITTPKRSEPSVSVSAAVIESGIAVSSVPLTFRGRHGRRGGRVVAVTAGVDHGDDVVTVEAGGARGGRGFGLRLVLRSVERRGVAGRRPVVGPRRQTTNHRTANRPAARRLMPSQRAAHRLIARPPAERRRVERRRAAPPQVAHRPRHRRRSRPPWRPSPPWPGSASATPASFIATAASSSAVGISAFTT